MRKALTLRFQMLFLSTITLLAGCGEVIVFGHTVREGHTASEPKAEPTALTAATAPSSATTATTNSDTTIAEKKAAATVVTRTVHQVKAVSISIASQAAEQVAKDSRFNMDALRDMIKSELQSRKLFDANNSSASSTVEVIINNYELHPKTNFAIFGYIPNIGILNGNLLSHDEHGTLTNQIEAQTGVSVPASGEVDNMLKPLYHEFAVAVADVVAGTPSKSGVDVDSSR